LWLAGSGGYLPEVFGTPNTSGARIRAIVSALD
jgi:hypothetical protein